MKSLRYCISALIGYCRPGQQPMGGQRCLCSSHVLPCRYSNGGNGVLNPRTLLYSSKVESEPIDLFYTHSAWFCLLQQSIQTFSSYTLHWFYLLQQSLQAFLYIHSALFFLLQQSLYTFSTHTLHWFCLLQQSRQTFSTFLGEKPPQHYPPVKSPRSKT